MLEKTIEWMEKSADEIDRLNRKVLQLEKSLDVEMHCNRGAEEESFMMSLVNVESYMMLEDLIVPLIEVENYPKKIWLLN